MSGGWETIEPGAVKAVAIIAGFFLLAIILGVRANARRSALMQEYAASHGWRFSRPDPDGLSAVVESYFPDERFVASNVLEIETGNRTIRLFDCQIHSRTSRRGGNYGTGCLIGSSRFRAFETPVEIVVRGWVNLMSLSGKVDLGDCEFSRAFIVRAKDPVAARDAITPELRKALLAHEASPLVNPIRVAITSSGAVVLTGMNATEERWNDLIALVRRIESSLALP